MPSEHSQHHKPGHKFHKNHAHAEEKATQKMVKGSTPEERMKIFLEDELENFKQLRDEFASKIDKAALAELDQIIADREHDIPNIVDFTFFKK